MKLNEIPGLWKKPSWRNDGRERRLPLGVGEHILKLLILDPIFQQAFDAKLLSGDCLKACAKA